MEKELKLIIESCGKEIFADADALMQNLRQSGCSEKDVMTAGLILKACPSVGRMLAQGQATQAEVNVLVSTVVAATGLSVHTARTTLGEFMRACGIQGLWVPYLLLNEPKPSTSVTPMILNEKETMEELMQRLREDESRCEAIHDLDVLSLNGNIRASYSLGQFYKHMDNKYDTANGKIYFERAARQGYGPANGALADYAVRGKYKNMTKAAKYFEDPTTLSGTDGREWATLSTQLLNYREENEKRIKSTLGLQIAMLALTVLLLLAGLSEVGFLSILGLLLQLGSLGWSLYSRVFGPYHSCRIACYAMTLSWLALVLGML